MARPGEQEPEPSAASPQPEPTAQSVSVVSQPGEETSVEGSLLATSEDESVAGEENQPCSSVGTRPEEPEKTPHTHPEVPVRQDTAKDTKEPINPGNFYSAGQRRLFEHH